MTNQINQKVQLLVNHFIVRNDEVFSDDTEKNPNKIMAELFIKITITEGLFDERHIFSKESNDNHQLDLNECLQQIKDGKEGADSALFEVIANHESYKYRLEIPYEDITKLIYDADVDFLGLDQKFQGFEFVLKEVASKCDLIEQRKIEKTYKKLKRHLRLAVAQKQYFQSITEQARASALSADEQSKKAKETAENAEKEALNAQEVSKKAQAMSDGMITNFVTILGVFATIIITVFGGINIVGATVKLLEGNNKLVYLVFVVSFLMVCLLTLIRLLISWITSIRGVVENDKNISDTDQGKLKYLKYIINSNFYTRSILSFLVVIALSGICIACNPKDQETKPKQEDLKSNNNSVLIISNNKPESLENKDLQKLSPPPTTK